MKSFTERERKRCSTIQSSLASTEQEVSRLQSLLEAQRGEVESMQTHMDVLETKHQSDIQKLEAEHKINAEKQVLFLVRFAIQLACLAQCLARYDVMLVFLHSN